MKCECCGEEMINGICENCGLVDDEYQEYQDDYPLYEEDDKHQDQHGGLRTHDISDIAVMTVVNPNETHDTDLKRALKMDGWFGWDVQSSEIIANEVERIIFQLHLDNLFKDDCFYFLRKYRENLDLSGRALEDVAPALVYTVLRMNKRSYTLWDFKQLGYNTKTVYNIYIFLVKQLKLYDKIIPQNAETYVKKLVNDIISDEQSSFEFKSNLAQYVIKSFLGWLCQIRPANIVDLNNFDGGAGLIAAGACVYKTLKEFKHPQFKPKNLTQNILTDYCGCSEVTFRKYITRIENFDKQSEKDS